MPEDDSCNDSRYGGTTYDDVHCLRRKALEERKERRLRCLFDGRCAKVVSARFQKGHERLKKNVYTLVLDVIEHTAVKVFFTGEAKQLRAENMYKPTRVKDFT